MKKIIFLFFCFVYLTFAQNDDPSKGTLYEKGGYFFETVGSNDTIYRIKFSFDQKGKKCTLEQIEPKPTQILDGIPFTKFNSVVLRNGILKNCPDIDSKALCKLIKELNKSNQKYIVNKFKSDKYKDLKKTGKYYSSIIKNKIFKIKLSYIKKDNLYKVVKIFPDPSSNQTSFLYSKNEIKNFVTVIHNLFEKDFEFNANRSDSSGNDLTLVDSLNLYKLGIDFYTQIQSGKQFIEKKSNELRVAKKNKEKEKLKKLLEKEKRIIGKIGFRKNLDSLAVPLFNWIEDLKDSCRIPIVETIGIFQVENAQIAFGDGVISKIIINGKLYINGEKSRKITFCNFTSPIPIRTREHIDRFNSQEGFRYWLHAEESKSGNYSKVYRINLSDVLYYEQNLIYNYGIYIPPDGKVISLNDAVAVFDLKKESFVNDFDLRIYTDVTGLNADNPNGLIKFMGNYKMNINSPEWNSRNRNGWCPFTLNYANLFFNFNKIESDKLVLPIKQGNNFVYSTTFDLYRYSKFELGIDLNILYWQFQYASLSFNFLLGTYHTPVDSVFTINNNSLTISGGVNSFNTGLKLNYRYLANEYVDVNLGYSFIIPQLFSDDKLKEVFGSIDDPDSESNIRKEYCESGFKIHRINAELSIFPNPQDRSSFIFLKSILNFNSSDNYISLLIGYAVPFSNIFAIGRAP